MRGGLRGSVRRSYSTLNQLQRAACAKYGEAPLFGEKRDGKYEWTSYSKFDSHVTSASHLINEAGIVQGDSVAIISSNSIQWATCAYATYSAGASFTPMYENQKPQDWKYILEDCGAKIVFCSNDKIAEQVSALGLTQPLEIVSQPTFWNHIKNDQSHVKIDVKNLDSNSLSNLIYTSGTSGVPKGVELSHANIVSNVLGIEKNFRGIYGPGDKLLSHLPWAHAYAQTVELHAGIHIGATMGIAQSVETIRQDLLLVEPDILVSVPSLFVRIYDGVMANIAKSSPTKQKIFRRALEVATRRRERLDAGQSVGLTTQLQYSLLNKLALSKVRAALGPNLRMTVSGGAALDSQVNSFFNALGLTVYEGYGLTETSPIITANSPALREVGTVGGPLTDEYIVTIRDPSTNKVLPDGQEGEICASGPNVMLGYHNNPKATAEVIFTDEDGRRTFHTEDMGFINQSGALKVTGRIKEKYKLSNGKFVVPNVVEGEICKSRFIQQCFVHGMNLPYNIVVVVPSWVYVAEHLGLQLDTPIAELARNPSVINLIEDEVANQSKQLKSYEAPRSVILASVAMWTVESGMVTPKMSLKRRELTKEFDMQIRAAFSKEKSQ